jgi:hypothetical protein
LFVGILYFFPDILNGPLIIQICIVQSLGGCIFSEVTFSVDIGGGRGEINRVLSSALEEEN